MVKVFNQESTLFFAPLPLRCFGVLVCCCCCCCCDVVVNVIVVVVLFVVVVIVVVVVVGCFTLSCCTPPTRLSPGYKAKGSTCEKLIIKIIKRISKTS